MNDPILIIVTFTIIAIIIVICILNVIQHKKNKKFKDMIERLEVEKNIIDSSPIIPELAKVENILKNEKLEVMYNDWKDRLDNIKTKQIPKISDMLIDAEYSLDETDYKATIYKIAKLEMEIYKVRTNSEFLLNEIKEITSSEEKNRAYVTKLKSDHRNLFKKFNDRINEYGFTSDYIKKQFGLIQCRFEDFEDAQENNEVTEIPIIIKSIEDMLKHMTTFVDEVPDIMLMSCNLLPKRIEELEKTYNNMLKEEYPLDYLNIEYNIDEARKKLDDFLKRLRDLNIEDSLFDLKVLSEYFDQVFQDLEKEKINRKEYALNNRNFKKRLDGINNVVSNIFNKIDELKQAYNLNDEEVKYLTDINRELNKLNNDYKVLSLHISNNTFAYSKLVKEIDDLNIRLNTIEDRLDESLESVGNLKEDESRARQQLEEIKGILKESKHIIRGYNFSTIPTDYYTQLEEANAAVKEIVKELSRQPISIDVLNTRVDTARDLTLKLYKTSKDLVKLARISEIAIVYGNRYRPIDTNLDRSLSMAEMCFYRGDYRKSLDISINSINKIEPNIYAKLVNSYKEL